jgi:hypothetical protein
VSLQNIVYHLEQGALRQLVVAGACLVILSVFAVYFSATQFKGLNYATAMDQAQVAREFSRGHGWTTKFVRPLAIHQIEAHKKGSLDFNRFPDTVNPPLYPAVLGTVFKLTGTDFDVKPEALRSFTRYAPETWILVLNGFLAVFAMILAYLWAVRTFDHRVAVCMVILVGISELFWSHVISGLPTSLLMALLAGIGLLLNESSLASDEERPAVSLGCYLGACLLAGLACLTSYLFIGILPALILFGMFAIRPRYVAGVVGGLLALGLISVWLLRNYQITGHPFGTSWAFWFFDYNPVMGNELWRILDYKSGDVVSFRHFMRALLLGLQGQMAQLTVLIGSVPVLVLFGASIFHVFRSSHAQWNRWFWVVAAFGLFLANAFGFRENRPESWMELNNLVVLLPALALFGSAFLFVLIERMSLPVDLLKHAVVFLVCLAGAVPLMARVFLPGSPTIFAYPPYFPPILVFAKQWIGPEEAYVSDMPWASSWYSDRTVMWIPRTRKEFLYVNDFQKKMVALLVTPISRDASLHTEIENGEYRDWHLVIKRQSLMELPFGAVTRLPPNNEYLILADQKRW